MAHEKKHNIALTLSILALVIFGIYAGAQALWGEHSAIFFKGILKNPMQVGAFTPCSVYVAEEATKHVAQGAPNLSEVRVLEVGGGSGVLSTELEKILRNHPNYHLDIIEIDEEYCSILKKKFESNTNVTVHCMSITDFVSEKPYNYIVSTLPFTVMDIPSLQKIFDIYYDLIVDGGNISYVEHMWLPDIKRNFLSQQDLSIYDAKRELINTFKKAHLLEIKNVYANITPLFVYHLQVSK